MSSGPITGAQALRAARRQEAELLLCRLLSDFNLMGREINEVRNASLDAELLRRDPSHVADNLLDTPPALMYYDLQRLLTLVREGL